MKNIKKTLFVCVSLVMVALIAIGGTVAYLTVNPVNRSNIFTIGDISIELNEITGIKGEGGELTRDDETGATYSGVMPGDYLTKEVSVKNTGSKPAYVAVEVTLNNADLINKSIDEFYEGKGYSADEIQAVYDFIFDGWGINYNPRPDDGGISATGAKNARGVIDGTFGLPEHTLKVDFAKTTDVDNDTYMIDTSNWFKTEQENNGKYSGFYPASKGYYTADMADYELRYTYYILLEADEETVIFKGLNVPAEFNAEQLKMFGNLHIDVVASAIQADNFASAQDAFTTLKKEVVWEVSTADELQDRLNAGGNIALAADIDASGESFVIPEDAEVILDLKDKKIVGNNAKNTGTLIANNGTLTIAGGNITNTAVNGDSIIANNGTLVLDGVSIVGAPMDSTGYPAYAVITSGKLTVEEGTTISADRGAISMSNGADVVINGGNIVVSDAADGRNMTLHTIYAYGYDSTLTIYDGNFEQNHASTGGASVICPAGATINIYGGDFRDSMDDTGWTSTGNFQNYMGYGAPVNVYGGTYDDNTVNKNLAEGYITVDNGDGTYTVEKKIVPDGTTLVSEGLYVDADGVYYITNATGLASMGTMVADEGAYNDDGTWVLYTDIDMTGVDWTPINGFYGTFDGNNKTISNLTVTSEGEAGFFGVIRLGADSMVTKTTIKNVTFANAKVTGNVRVGVVAAQMGYGLIENITVTGAVVDGNKYVAGIVGYSYMDGGIKVTDCTVTNSTIKAEGADADGKVGGVGGYIANGTIKNNTVTGCTISGPECVGGIVGRGGSGDGTVAVVVGNTVSNNSVTGTETATVGDVIGHKLNVKESE